MDRVSIRYWIALFQENPEAAAHEFRRRQQAIAESQREAIWAWQDTGDLWNSSPPGGPLQGVPFACKDLYHLKETRTRAGSMLPAPTRKNDGALVAALRSMGALPVGKTHLHELAYGLTGENPHFGNVQHPHFPDRSSGGSSSGSAAVVGAGVVPFALGTDTAGSLRVPASYCGLFSWRGQPGHPWIADAFPLAPKFDTAGWIAHTAADTLLLLESLGGQIPPPDQPPRGCYLPPSSLHVPTDHESEALLQSASLPLATTQLDADSQLACACRGVGKTYGVLQSTDAFFVHQRHLDSHRAAYGPEVWERLDRGRRWSARDIDIAALHALKIRAAFENYFTEFDFLVTPSTIEPAPLYSDKRTQIRDDLLQLNTHVSVAGLPALSFPVLLPNGLSLGLQVVFPHANSPAIKWVVQQISRAGA
ncbi:amidase [Opitutaceae bacterium]|nr:amidase [bacterium]MDB4385021.1 amidase [Opitutaceae bacterium]